MRCALRNETEVADFIRGTTFYGTGGGGRPEDGFSHLVSCLEAGLEISWEDPAAIQDDVWTCTLFGMGSIAPAARPDRPPYGLDQKTVEMPMVEAVRRLEEYAGVEIGAVVPFELGGSNTAKALSAACRLGALVPDGDMCGRAVPELTQTACAIAGVSPVPAAIADDWGNVVLVKSAATLAALEALGKYVSIVTKAPDPTATCAHAAYLMKGSDLKRVLVGNTLSKCLELGRSIRLCREEGRDVISEICAVAGGRILFTGSVVRKDWKNEQGYMFGTTTVAGTGEFEGKSFKVWFKNENHIAWRDDSPVCMSPDLICIVREDGEPVTNTMLAEGQSIACIGIPNVRFRSPEGLGALGPSHFGFDLEYVPLTG